MDVHNIFTFQVLPPAADYVFQVVDTHGVISVQKFAALACEETKCLLFAGKALAELLRIYALRGLILSHLFFR